MRESPIITRMLKIADPTMVPAQIFSFPPDQKIAKIAKILVNNSGAELHIAIKVAPTTSDDNLIFSEIFSNELTKYLSETKERR